MTSDTGTIDNDTVEYFDDRVDHDDSISLLIMNGNSDDDLDDIDIFEHNDTETLKDKYRGANFLYPF